MRDGDAGSILKDSFDWSPSSGDVVVLIARHRCDNHDEEALVSSFVVLDAQI
jgi:hypothetical protein